jgi:hypothetical protein
VIGLVYTIGSHGPAYREPFDLAARLGFEFLAACHPAETGATGATGAGVTTKALRALVKASEFVFYWGHGSSSRRGGAETSAMQRATSIV